MGNPKFVHFNGFEREWTNKLNSGVYDKCVVFAKIWSPNRVCSFKVYAGKDCNGNEYSFDIPSASALTGLETRLSKLELLFIVNDDSAVLSDIVKNAIDAYIRTSEVISSMNEKITEIEQSIVWHDESDVENIKENN